MKTRLSLAIAVGVLALGGLFYLSGHDPESGAIYPKCLFKEVTGLHCAGCGGTRAAYALTNFDLATAFRKNPLLVAALPFLAVGVLIEGAAWLLGDRYRGPRVRFPLWYTWLFPIVIIGYWVLRNVPVWPFELLAPR